MTEGNRRTAHWDVLEDPEGVARHGYSAVIVSPRLITFETSRAPFSPRFTDADLDRLFSVERRSGSGEASLRWILHHLVDPEAQHKGQILMLKRLLV